MNGFAGLSRRKKQKQELAGSNGAVPASEMESGDPVVGQAVRIVEACPLWVISGHLSVYQRMSALRLRADMFSIGVDVC